MTDVNEQRMSAGNHGSGRLAPRARERLATPIWRFRPATGAVVATLRTHIIPKIVLALRSLPAVAPDHADHAERSAIEAFADLAVGIDDEAAVAHVERLLAAGASVESILLELLAPTARHLGTLWESDATDFVTVTLGVSRLQRIMRRLGELFFEQGRAATGGESVLLTAVPGEQHSFGLSMVAEFFRRAGWNLCTGPFVSHQELIALVQSHWFDVVGFSVSSDRRLDELKQDIRAIRRDSRNRQVGIMLGGPMMMVQPELVASMGADMMSIDAATAPHQARALIRQMTNRT
ncbi:MAG: cobalamin-binding protein [Tardiphaga sp.]|jgi:methanogenic corrinoid protein MtbC1|nr:cobalamin-binding protein [Tardiphaga sp.]